MQQLLKVFWWYGVEFVVFDEDDFHPQMTTTERWRDGTEVTYNVDAEFTRRGKSRSLELIYQRDKQTHPYVVKQRPGEIRYGVSTINWSHGSHSGEAWWKDDDNPKVWNNKKGKKVDVLGGQTLEISERAKRSVLIAQRPGQAAFRDALSLLDKQCVLTDENCAEALQAAHIVPVTRRGHEQIENGILLRADLHLLFDSGLIWFDVTKGHATVRCSSDLTSSYMKDLNNKKLPSKTFQRVKTALQKRSKLPGGHGRDSATTRKA
jgi:hypothetical protein